jgi:hypothetical protein
MALKKSSNNKQKGNAMNKFSISEECRSYIDTLIKVENHEIYREPEKSRPAITISRQAGARGRSIGKKLKQALREQSPKDEIPWTYFDGDLVEKVLKDHDLPTSLAKFMPEDSVSEIDSTINEILGRHPSLWTLFEHTTETMLHLCRTGHCILVGRGGNKVAEGLGNVTRVRFVGSKQRRLLQMIQVHKMSLEEAKTYIKKEDRARQRYMKSHFNCNIDDPLHYDLVINTDHYSDEAVVQIIINAISSK